MDPFDAFLCPDPVETPDAPEGHLDINDPGRGRYTCSCRLPDALIRSLANCDSLVPRSTSFICQKPPFLLQVHNQQSDKMYTVAIMSPSCTRP